MTENERADRVRKAIETYLIENEGKQKWNWKQRKVNKDKRGVCRLHHRRI